MSKQDSGAIAPRECGDVSNGRHPKHRRMGGANAKPTIVAAVGFAEPVIGRAFARPVGSTHPTRPNYFAPRSNDARGSIPVMIRLERTFRLHADIVSLVL